jgi:hypothetical protein
MSSFGLSINNSSGVEVTRYSTPIAAIFAFPVTGNGSVTVPGSFAHSVIIMSPAIALLAPNVFCHNVTLSSDDVVSWSNPIPYVTTLIFMTFCK